MTLRRPIGKREASRHAALLVSRPHLERARNRECDLQPALCTDYGGGGTEPSDAPLLLG